MNQIVETAVVAVTVYPDRALVTRRGVVCLSVNQGSSNQDSANQDAGNQSGNDAVSSQVWELIIANLPMSVNRDSLRVRGTSNIPVRLFGARCEVMYTTEPVTARVAQITQQIEEVEAEKRSLDAQLEALALQSSFLQGLREKTEEQVAISLARKSMNLSDTLDLLNFFGSQYGEYAIASEDYKSQKRSLDKQLQVLRANLKQVETPESKASLNAIIPIEFHGEGEFTFELSYVLNGASWLPIYDVRVDSSRNEVNLSCFAEISQKTGEDWENVHLRLSTAKPGLGTLPPRLEPWYVNIYDPRPPRSVTRAAVADNYGIQPSPYYEEEGEQTRTRSRRSVDESETNWDEITAETVTAEVVRTGNIVTFDLPNHISIKSDSTPYKTNVFNDEFPSHFLHIAMPSVVSFAYLQAEIQNKNDGRVLLPGKANIFRDDVFVGATQIENIAPGEKFKINLGIDENLKIDRQLVERQVDKKLIGSDRKITYAYKLLVDNLGNRPVNLVISEQIPKSRHEKIKVRLSNINPSTQPSEMGILEWELQLKAHQKQEVYYQFVVEYPSNLRITGLDV